MSIGIDHEIFIWIFHFTPSRSILNKSLVGTAWVYLIQMCPANKDVFATSAIDGRAD